jgi:hypothetical protein
MPSTSGCSPALAVLREPQQPPPAQCNEERDIFKFRMPRRTARRHQPTRAGPGRSALRGPGHHPPCRLFRSGTRADCTRADFSV